MRRWGVALLALVLLAPAAARAGLPRLHAERGASASAGIYDDAGRQVLLRGVDVNALGDYYAVAPTLAPVVALTEQDFADIAQLGMDEVRLIVSWSSLEPHRGAFDAAYVARIRQAVTWAAAHDIHVVLDMHQDAWGKYVATPPGEHCLPGFSPGQGWDGAPAWATLTDGLPTCRLGTREISPAVFDAWQSFWDDRSGIQGELVATWAKLAQAFAADPTIVGYDLLNEPNPGVSVGATQVALIGSFYARAIAAIRRAEAGAPGGYHHIVFFEPSVEWSAVGSTLTPLPTFTADRNVVFSPHLYGGSLAAVSVDAGFRLAAMSAAGYGTTVWSGEWGWFGDPTAEAGKIAAYARQEDAYRWGGAWWQWKQACGDPHNFAGPSGPPGDLSPSLNRYACPAQTALGIPASTARILARAYPRAAPGRLDTRASDPSTGRVEVRGRDADPGGSCALDVWAPRERKSTRLNTSHPQHTIYRVRRLL
ncbi:MAG: putative secreted endoglycosylceramidase, partial [Solirubrobacterales bacterium]|nr:putative secreted endoglycosylceramidase [Solirubrobacterales bacterium]